MFISKNFIMPWAKLCEIDNLFLSYLQIVLNDVTMLRSNLMQPI